MKVWVEKLNMSSWMKEKQTVRKREYWLYKVYKFQIRFTFFFAGLFTINSVTGEVKTHKDLTGRGRTDPDRLLVGALDGGGHTGDTSLSLYIGDVSANDGVPRFIRPASGEVLSVSEVS